MNLEQRIKAFSALGNHLQQMSSEAFESLAESARMENPWFTNDNIKKSLEGITRFLSKEVLTEWTSRYTLNPNQPKTVALVMAGNIPLVGFHDLLCVLISGHQAQIKLSSKDSKLLTYLMKHLVWLEPEFETHITIKETKIENYDAVIATGGDNSARYFHEYFGKYAHIIRKNRTSVAILNGFETKEELEILGIDVFSYFGLGCRNVSKVYVPKEYDFPKLLDHWNSFKDVILHHKYNNNYDYQKSILLVNRVHHLDNGFVLLQENEKLVSPISVLYYEYYSDQDDLKKKLTVNEDKIQCLVGNAKPATIPFGKAQFPDVWDYADQIDTLKFLSELE
jgi:hypothetical protein